jgi:hypothetical protein
MGWGICVECQNVSVSSPGSQLARQPRGSIGAWVWRPWWKRAVTIRSALPRAASTSPWAKTP